MHKIVGALGLVVAAVLLGYCHISRLGRLASISPDKAHEDHSTDIELREPAPVHRPELAREDTGYDSIEGHPRDPIAERLHGGVVFALDPQGRRLPVGNGTIEINIGGKKETRLADVRFNQFETVLPTNAVVNIGTITLGGIAMLPVDQEVLVPPTGRMLIHAIIPDAVSVAGIIENLPATTDKKDPPHVLSLWPIDAYGKVLSSSAVSLRVEDMQVISDGPRIVEWRTSLAVGRYLAAINSIGFWQEFEISTQHMEHFVPMLIPPLGSHKIRCVDESGKPVAIGGFTLYPAHQHQMHARSHGQAVGARLQENVMFYRVVPGPFEVQLRGSLFAKVRQTTVVNEGENPELEVVVRQTPAVRLSLVDQRGPVYASKAWWDGVKLVAINHSGTVVGIKYSFGVSREFVTGGPMLDRPQPRAAVYSVDRSGEYRIECPPMEDGRTIRATVIPIESGALSETYLQVQG